MSKWTTPSWPAGSDGQETFIEVMEINVNEDESETLILNLTGENTPVTWPWRYRCAYCKAELIPVYLKKGDTFSFNCIDLCLIYAQLENREHPMWPGGGEPYDHTKSTDTFHLRDTTSGGGQR